MSFTIKLFGLKYEYLKNIFTRITLLKWLLLGSVLGLSACATTKLYTPENFCLKELPAGMSRISIYRDTGVIAGGGAVYSIKDNGQAIGAVKNKETICWDRYPGTAIITVFDMYEFTIEAQEGKNHKYRMEQIFHFFSDWELFLKEVTEIPGVSE